MTPSERDEVRRRAPLSVFWQLLDAAKKQVDVVAWRRMGGPEAADFLHALETGRQHPWLDRWLELRRTVAANRPVPSLLDQNARRLTVLLCVALVRAGLGKDAARRRAAEAVKHLLPA